MRRLAFVLILLGCDGGPAVLGEEARIEELEASAQAVDVVLRSPNRGEVVLSGHIGQVCSEGCWFYLLGESGVLYVKLDLTNGLQVSPKSVGKKALVKGTLQTDSPTHTLLAETVVLY